MRDFLKGVEMAADRLIAPALVVVLFIVGIELLMPEVAHHHHTLLNFLDFLVIIVFATDLSFKLHRASSWEGFLSEYWLEIVAIMPMFWVFRFLEGLAVTRAAEVGQDAAHLGTRAERFAAFFRSAEATRTGRLARVLRLSSRLPRFAKAAQFFEHPAHSS